MALAQIYTAVPNDVITAARWNNEFGNILNNGTDVAFPLTKAVSLAGFTLTLDAAGVSTIISSASQAIQFTPGAKSGTPNTTGKALNVVAQTFTDSATAASGTATSMAFVAIQQPTLDATNASVTTTEAATLFVRGQPLAGANETITNSYAIWVQTGTVLFEGSLNVDSNITVGNDFILTGTPRGRAAFGKYIEGLTYANNGADATNDIDIAIGSATDNGTVASSRRLLVLTSALTKQSDVAWAVGTNAGMLDTGAVGNNDYYLWLIYRSDTSVVDVLSSLSATAPTMPTNYNFKRLFGWFRRSAGAIVAFHTYEIAGGGLEYIWDTPTLDVDLSATLTTSERTDVLAVPTAFSVSAHVNILIKDATVSTAIFYNSDHTDLAPSSTAAPLYTEVVHVAGQSSASYNTIRTSSAGAISARSSVATMDTYKVSTLGFTWSRR
ncbi:MAG: hypothetical protein L0287_00045 [Anaerolineae bacterium]|nr:hypothetical protein [Anaerolineae bacterium]